MHGRTQLRPIRANRAVLHGLIAALLMLAALTLGAVSGDAGPSLHEDIGWRGVLAVTVMLVICLLPFQFAQRVSALER